MDASRAFSPCCHVSILKEHITAAAEKQPDPTSLVPFPLSIVLAMKPENISTSAAVCCEEQVV